MKKCRSHFSPLTSHFSLLTSHFPLLNENYVNNNIIKEMNNHSSCTPSEYKKKSRQISKMSSKCSVIPNNSKISGEPEPLFSSGSFLVSVFLVIMGGVSLEITGVGGTGGNFLVQ